MPKIMRKINVISRSAGLYRSDKLEVSDLTPCHHSCIFALCAAPGISQDELARRLCINKSSVTRQLAYLQEHSYVERKSSPTDKRMLLVYPTQKMLDVLPRIRQLTKEWNEYLTSELDEEELNVFLSVLDRISQRAQAYADARDEVAP